MNGVDTAPVESATLGTMSEPQTAGTVLESMRERLARMGMDPALVDAPVEPQVGVPESPEDRAERLALQARNRASRWRSALPAIYREASLDALRPEQHPQDVRSWLPSGRLGLLLVGGVGTGKTYAAYALGNAAVERGRITEAWRVHDLLAACRPGGDPTAESRARSAELLILDDLMGGQASPFAVETLTAILDERVNHGRRTVVTTNLSADEMTEVWGPRLLDRVTYRADVVKFAGQSLRRSW